MCGVAGIYNFNKQESVSPEILKRMLVQIQHRGPDENGMYLGENLGIGSVRLSIIDISTGQQPLCDETGNYWIVFNGEIFNYIELKKDLEARGAKFKTSSDTEVLVQLYAIYGEACLNMLNGQFAFAIWDKKRKTLFLARDRVGIRPLFYYKNENTFVFGSEIKSLIECPDVSLKISNKALQEVFTFWTPLTPGSVFENVFELPAGHFMKVSAEGMQIEKFWELSFKDQQKKINLKDSLEEFSELFYDAIRIRLRADVPVAAYLSGGLDSTTTTAVIKEIEPSVLQTFSIGFSEGAYDETNFQQEAAKFLDTRHLGFTCTNEDIANNFQSVIWHAETPLLRTAPTPMYILSKMVREQGIKVVITGEGADEILGGYDIFKETMIRHFWAKYPDSKYRPLLLGRLYPYIPQIKNASPKILSFFYGYQLENTESPYYSHLLRWNNHIHIKKHLSSQLLEELNGYDPVNNVDALLPTDFNRWDPLAKAQWLETQIFMTGYLLAAQGDRMAMANSVEGRYPFLDYRVIEFVSKLPSDVKLKGLNEKYFLKKFIDKKIPGSILKRPKQAYRAPIAGSLLNENAPEYFKYLLSEDMINLHQIFNPESVKSLITKMKKSPMPSEMDSMALTAILSTQIISDMFIKGNRPKADISKLKNTKIVQQKS